jgi:hypothetical protein
LDFQELAPPLSQFNGTKPAKDDLQKLVISINKSLGDGRLPEEVLREAFEQWWPRFESSFEKILQELREEVADEPKRSIEDMFTELLQLMRSVHSSVASQNSRARLANAISKMQAPKQPPSNFDLLRKIISQSPSPPAQPGDLLSKLLEEKVSEEEREATGDTPGA